MVETVQIERPASIAAVLGLIDELIDELQQELEVRPSRFDRKLLAAKRDTLTELKFRVRDGEKNPYWARVILVQPW